MNNRDLSAVAAVARSWEEACRSGVTERIVAHLSDDATVWFNFEQVDHDRDGYRAILDASRKTFLNAGYDDFRVLTHPGGFVEQATLRGDTPSGRIETPFLLVATVTGDRISRIEEYFDSTIMREQA